MKMSNDYYDTVDKMEKTAINREYMVGWMSGYLHNPKLEEQRITDAYTAGYEDGLNQNTEHMEEWTASNS